MSHMQICTSPQTDNHTNISHAYKDTWATVNATRDNIKNNKNSKKIIYQLHHAKCTGTQLASYRWQELTEQGQTGEVWCIDAQHVSTADSVGVTSTHCARMLPEGMPLAAETHSAQPLYVLTHLRRLTSATKIHATTESKRWTCMTGIGICHVSQLTVVCLRLTDLYGTG